MVVGLAVEYLTKVKGCRYDSLALVVAFNTLPSDLISGSYLLCIHKPIQTNFLLPFTCSYNIHG